MTDSFDKRYDDVQFGEILEEIPFQKFMKLGKQILKEEYAQIQRMTARAVFRTMDRTDENTKFETAEISRPEYNVSFDKSEQKESSIHFGLFGNEITAYDISRTDEKFLSEWGKLSTIEQEQYQRFMDNADISTLSNINCEKLSIEQIDKYMPVVFFIVFPTKSIILYKV